MDSKIEEKRIIQLKKDGNEIIKVEIPQLKTLTVVGKIDIDAINVKTKPKKKPRNQLLKEQEERFHLEKEKRKLLKKTRKEKKKEIEIENMPKIGEIFWLEVKEINKRNKPIFLVADKYRGKVAIDTKNYPNIDTRKAVRTALSEVPIGQKLLCKVMHLNDNKRRISLKWLIEKDPYAKKFPKLNKSKTPKLLSVIQNWFKKLRGRKKC
jgi:hypothetical protein